MIKRDKYLSFLIKSIKNGFLKVITGVKRCGKSYLLMNIFAKYLYENYGYKCNQIIIELDNFKICYVS
jgi:predicted AAA+ superfamily ATPase